MLEAVRTQVDAPVPARHDHQHALRVHDLTEAVVIRLTIVVRLTITQGRQGLIICHPRMDISSVPPPDFLRSPALSNPRKADHRSSRERSLVIVQRGDTVEI